MRDETLLDNIEEGIEAIKRGEVVIVVDDEDRENEGDFICAAEAITPEIVNFMAKHGRGLICTPLVEERCSELDLELMVGKNTAIHGTPFTVSVDLIDEKVATGISAEDRYWTIKSLVDPNTKPSDLGRPGHIFPLKAKKEEVITISEEKKAEAKTIVKKPEVEVKQVVDDAMELDPKSSPKTEILYAQPKPNGFQVVDMTPKVVMFLLETTKADVFMVEDENAIVYKEDGFWYLSKYNGDKVTLIQLNLKF